MRKQHEASPQWEGSQQEIQESHGIIVPRPGALRIRKPSLDSLFRLWTNKAVWESGHWACRKRYRDNFLCFKRPLNILKLPQIYYRLFMRQAWSLGPSATRKTWTNVSLELQNTRNYKGLKITTYMQLGPSGQDIKEKKKKKKKQTSQLPLSKSQEQKQGVGAKVEQPPKPPL